MDECIVSYHSLKINVTCFLSGFHRSQIPFGSYPVENGGINCSCPSTFKTHSSAPRSDFNRDMLYLLLEIFLDDLSKIWHEKRFILSCFLYFVLLFLTSKSLNILLVLNPVNNLYFTSTFINWSSFLFYLSCLFVSSVFYSLHLMKLPIFFILLFDLWLWNRLNQRIHFPLFMCQEANPNPLLWTNHRLDIWLYHLYTVH